MYMNFHLISDTYMYVHNIHSSYPDVSWQIPIKYILILRLILFDIPNVYRYNRNN